MTLELVGRIDNDGRLETEGNYSQVVTQASAIQGLVFAFHITAEQMLQDAVLNLWDHMDTLWDDNAEVYVPSRGDTSYRYTARDVGDIVGAFNALLNGLSIDVSERFAKFFHSAVSESGLQIAEGEPTGGDKDTDTIPGPIAAGGPFGQGPVLATEVVYRTSSNTWEVIDSRFTTAYAMSANNQFMWIGTWAGKPSVTGHGIPNNSIFEASLSAK